MLRSALLVCVFAVVGAKDCTAVAKYPDGSEVERCAGLFCREATCSDLRGSERAPSDPCLHTARAWQRLDSRACRQCIVEGEGKGGAKPSHSRKKSMGISEEFAWMKDTRWNWNNWRD
eukprot:1333905-Prymnesium_polylepis.1